MTTDVQKIDPQPTGEGADHLGSTLTSDHVSRNWHNMDNRLSLIAEAAYFKAEKRGFEPCHEAADWLAAEQELAEIMGVA